MKIAQITKVILSESELSAIDTIAQIDCDGISCPDCPLYQGRQGCLRTHCLTAGTKYREYRGIAVVNN